MNLKNQLKVSVIMSVYNGELYVHEAITSILNQTFTNFEFIIIDDASSDNSLELIKSFADKRIKVLCNKFNMKLSASLNRGIKIARGEYIARMDVDDISLPNRLEKQVEYLDNNPKIGMVGTARYDILFSGERMGKVIPPISYEEIRDRIIHKNPFFHSSVLIKKIVFERVGLYNVKWKYSQDYEFWLRVIKQFKMANLEEILIIRRVPDKSKFSLLYERNEKERWFYSILARVSALRQGGYSFRSYLDVGIIIMSFLFPERIKIIKRKLLKKVLSHFI